MASGLHFFQANLLRNLSQCIKHSTYSINPHKSRWRSITSLSIFNPGLVDDTYPDVKKCDTATKTLDFYELKKKEKGDWRNLTLQERQALYHMSFNQPFCYDVEQPIDEWKFILGGTFTAMGLMTLGLYIWLSYSERAESVIGPLSLQIDPKNKEEMSMSFNKELSQTEKSTC